VTEEERPPRKHGGKEENGIGREGSPPAEPRVPGGLIAEPLTEQIIGAAIEVHRELGPGLLESVYEECLCWEFRSRNISFVRQLELPIIYKGRRIQGSYRLDLVVDDAVVVEIKCVEKLLPVHEAQLLTYLKLTGKRVGLLINFKVPVLHRGIVRRVL
jgi:GxxExxY protein